MDGALRRRITRLCQLGVIATWEDEGWGRLSIVTAVGDRFTGDARQTDAYLTGLAHGAWAAHRGHYQPDLATRPGVTR